LKAIILAGGKGTRLAPYTTVIPKPLMPIGERPILEIILRQLKAHGIKEIILAVGHVSQLFQAFFKNGNDFGVHIDYSIEKDKLGTAGPISLVLDQLPETFLIMNGDLLTNLNYSSLIQYHHKQKAAATIALSKREVHVDYGVIESEAGRFSRYIEKPRYSFKVSMGINVLDREAVRPYLNPNQYMDIPDLMTALANDGKIISCYEENCRWLDIGRIDDYEQANTVFADNPSLFMPEDK
jgi:NDP-sugar pyrophosphorylase family protein